jgi:hypothetical protein
MQIFHNSGEEFKRQGLHDRRRLFTFSDGLMMMYERSAGWAVVSLVSIVIGRNFFWKQYYMDRVDLLSKKKLWILDALIAEAYFAKHVEIVNAGVDKQNAAELPLFADAHSCALATSQSRPLCALNSLSLTVKPLRSLQQQGSSSKSKIICRLSLLSACQHNSLTMIPWL